MELLRANEVNTTTQLAVNSNTATAKNVINRDLRFQYVSNGLSDDNTTATMVISFDETTTISRIGLMGINLKSFDVFYNGSTANTFSFTSTASTITSSFVSNSETSMYFKTNPVLCTSVSLDMKTTQIADFEKAIGYLVLSEEHIDFPRIPSADNYSPNIAPKQVKHNMSDGGKRVQTVADKHSVGVKFDYIEESFRDSLRTVYNLHEEMIFVGFATSTGWDEFIFQGAWSGPFKFLRYSDNASTAGFSGSITIAER